MIRSLSRHVGILTRFHKTERRAETRLSVLGDQVCFMAVLIELAMRPSRDHERAAPLQRLSRSADRLSSAPGPTRLFRTPRSPDRSESALRCTSGSYRG